MVLDPHVKLLVILVLCLVLISGFCVGLGYADDFDVDLEEDDLDDDDHGIIGGVFHFVGDVVAFPFRLIGGVFDAIF